MDPRCDESIVVVGMIDCCVCMSTEGTYGIYAYLGCWQAVSGECCWDLFLLGSVQVSWGSSVFY